jgi:hypothetical protein
MIFFIASSLVRRDAVSAWIRSAASGVGRLDGCSRH